MILAAPLVIPFAKAVGLSVGTLGMAALADKVNDYIETNPEESAMILKTLIPNLGIGEIFMNKEKISIEDLDEMSDQEAADLPTDIKADLMKQGGKSRGGGKRELMKELSRKLGLSGPGKEQKDMEYDADERYEGGVTEKADGGAIGVESLFEERENFRVGGASGREYGADTSASRGVRTSPSRGPSRDDRGPTMQTQIKKPVFKSDIAPQFQGLVSPAAGVKFDFLQKQKFYNQPFKLEGITPLELKGAEIEGGIGDLKNLMGGEMTVGSVLENMAGGGYGNVMPSTQNKLQEQILGQVDFGKTFQKDIVGPYNPVVNPTFKEGVLDIDVGKGDLVDEKAEKFLDLKEGGRVGFNVGGITDPAALSIYNSMNTYGFSDQEIADAITAQGYDAGTLGQGATIGKPIPVAPEPAEGIIGIDVQQRDTGGGFNPFGPLDSTFTKDLSGIQGFEELTPKEQMNKYKAQTQDNMFGLGRFFQPKIRGTLGNRLQKQFQTGQKLPSLLAQIAGTRSPFNVDSKNYNKDFVDQLNFLELGDDLIGMSGVGLKYGKGSVLFGKNVISGFGTNNYQKALEKFIAKAKGDRKRQGEIELQNFLNAEKARKEKEGRERQDMLEAAIRTRRDSGQSLSDIGRDMFTGRGQAFEKRSGGFSVDSSGNRRNYGGR
jgi:hypothetical protein